MVSSRRNAALALCLAALAACAGPPQRFPGPPTAVAPGVEFYKSTDSALVAGAGPIVISLLKIDPSKAQLKSALSNGEVVNAEPVDSIARRVGALAAINGGFFNRLNGEPVGLLKVSGELVSDARASKGAVIISRRPSGPVELTFDLLAAKMTAVFSRDGHEWRVPIDGVDTTRQRGKLMLYTPAYHDDTDTAPTGTEWVLDGEPLRVVDVLSNYGHTRIPRKGAVLSFGGVSNVPEGLLQLTEDVQVQFETIWRSVHGVDAGHLDTAESIVNGAGLLRRAGKTVTDWTAEGLSTETFTGVRHPRTMIGVDVHGMVWLAAIDGRQADYSIGMTFADLDRLCGRLQLRDALNLDGGGSTTMVVGGQIVNRPSDLGGPRPVSDAIVVVRDP